LCHKSIYDSDSSTEHSDCKLENEEEMALDRKFIATSSEYSDSDVEDEYDTTLPPKYIDNRQILYQCESNKELIDYKSREEDEKAFLNRLDRLSKGTITKALFALTFLIKFSLPNHYFFHLQFMKSRTSR
jgi:hypothetical protein